jgi:hypothetical protein
VEEQQRRDAAGSGADEAGDTGGLSLLGRITSFPDDVASQLEGLSGSLPDSGILSSAFRARVKQSVMLLLVAVFFAVMAIFVGLPTIVIKPTKFIFCTAMSTLCAIAAIVVMQKPEVFVASLFGSGISNALPFFLLLASLCITVYVTLFMHSYVMTMGTLGLQAVCTFWFLASFIPGGSKGLEVLARAGYSIVTTALRPIIYLCTKTISMALSRIFSS